MDQDLAEVDYEAEFDVLDFIDLVDDLTELLDTETRLLDEGKAHEIEKLLEDKQAFTDAVRQGALLIERDPDIIYADNPYAEEDAEELKAAIAALHEAAEVNERSLRAAVRSTDRLIRAVVTATAEVRAGADIRYNANGTSGAGKRAGGKLNAIDELL